MATKHKVGDPKGDQVRQNGRGSSPGGSAGVGDRTEEETSCPEDGEGDLATERTWMGYLLKGCGTRKVEGERDQDRSFNPKQRGSKCSSPTIDAIRVFSHVVILRPPIGGLAQRAFLSPDARVI